MLFQPTRTRLIPLSQGLWTLVDTADYPALNAHKWNARRSRDGGVYACRNVYDHGHVIHTEWIHRVVLELPPGRWPQGDHINRDSLDNRRVNLRVIPKGAGGNAQNRGFQTNNTSGFKGVEWHPQMKKWRANIGVNGAHVSLGLFDDPIEAAHVRDAAAVRFHGEYAWLNFPESS